MHYLIETLFSKNGYMYSVLYTSLKEPSQVEQEDQPLNYTTLHKKSHIHQNFFFPFCLGLQLNGSQYCWNTTASALLNLTACFWYLQVPENIPISFGINNKARLAAKTVFSLAHRHGDILREGWKNILDCMLQLYRAKLLPKSMIEVNKNKN